MASLKLLAVSLTRDLINREIAKSILLCQALFARRLLKVVSHFISGFLVLFTQVPLIKALFILNLHIDRIVYQTFILHCNGQFLDLVLTMNPRLLFPLLDEVLLLLFIIEVTIDWIKIVRFPIPLCRLSLTNLFISRQLLVMMLQILIRDNVVITEVFTHVCRNFLL